MKHKESISLDAGCGLGRIVKHYHNLGFNIKGCDFSPVAVKKLNSSNPELNIINADICHLPYSSSYFDNIFAFGVLHSIEPIQDILTGVQETYRCLKPNGKFIVSVRADTFENKMIDAITESRLGRGDIFHKWCFKKEEFSDMIRNQGFSISNTELSTNFCFLYKFTNMRRSERLSECINRSEGYKLNANGKILYSYLKNTFPKSFGTTFVYTCKK